MSHSLPTRAQGRGSRKIIESTCWQGCYRVTPSRYNSNTTLQLPAAVVAHTRPARNQVTTFWHGQKRGSQGPTSHWTAGSCCCWGWAARTQFPSVAWPMIGCQCSSGWSIPACMGNPDQTQKKKKKRNKDYIKFGGSFWGGFQEELGGRVYIIKIPCILSFSKKRIKNKMNPPPIFRGKRTAPLQPGTTTDRHISDHLKGVSHHLILSGLPQDIQPIRKEQVWPAIHCTLLSNSVPRSRS